MSKKNGVKGFFGEFKAFITRGNVLDMAVGVIVGGAFTAIVNALSNHILKPVINWVLALLLGENSLDKIFTFLKRGVDENGAFSLENSIYIDWGAFISAIINFLLIALVLFSIVKMINKFAEAHEKAKDEYETEREAVKKYRKEGLSKTEAVERYKADLEKAAAEKAEAERIAAEQAAKEAAEKAAMEEAKATANTRLLEEIRDLLKAQNK